MKAIAAGVLVLVAATTAPAPRGLEIYWVDVEGGGATLVVTPARESVLIDTGFPGDRDALRIHRVATQAAGLTRIDHVVVTHFHIDHFGGLASLSRLMPIGTLHERYLASAPEREQAQPELEAYKALAVGRRSTVKPGDQLTLEVRAGYGPATLRVPGRERTVRRAALARQQRRLPGAHRPGCRSERQQEQRRIAAELRPLPLLRWGRPHLGSRGRSRLPARPCRRAGRRLPDQSPRERLEQQPGAASDAAAERGGREQRAAQGR